ncbi:MAG: ATP-binding protein [Muribaculaceae bacterium]|nr:ATP-binding protein [Muribaculaceae bacterium]
MKIYREIIEKLIDWKNSSHRRPLILQGARQIGKTWVMKEFGHTYYRHTAYFNFDSNTELAREFISNKDPQRLLSRLALYTDVPLTPNDTLIIFDEIQESPEALNALKYFCEEARDYHIMAAGSLLGIAIHHHRGFPVGKVDFLRMYPVSFREYLRSVASDIVQYIDDLTEIEDLPEIVTGKLWDYFRAYQICGGMPKAVVASLENQGNILIAREQNEILTSYFLDFSKHANPTEFPKIAAVWQSLPSQLAKENRKFLYRVVKPGARAREYENALSWLREAGLIYQIYCCTKPGLPLSAFDELSAFKLYMLDIGLLREMAKLPAEIFTSPNDVFSEFKGALTENYIAQSIIPQLEALPRYWVSNGTAEIDFIIQDQLSILPIEVKSSINTAGKSLSVYISKYSPKYAIIFSAKPISVSSSANSSTTVINIPLPLADWTAKILSMVTSPTSDHKKYNM